LTATLACTTQIRLFRVKAMGKYIVKRILIAIPTLVLIAFFGYVIMELPRGLRRCTRAGDPGR
jgi:hypothetical protein